MNIEMTNEEKFKRELLVRKYSQNSIDTYVSCFKILEQKTDLKIESIKSFLITVNNRSYHKQLVATARNYYDFVLKTKLDLSELPYPRKEEKIPEVFSVEEIKKLIEFPKNLKHQVIICILYNCGLRISELINLQLSDIDRERMILKIKNSKQNKDRNVPIQPKILELIEKYYREYKPEKYLLNGQQGLLYTESSINQLLKYYAKKVGINKKIHAHKMRHCYATHLHESGTDLNIIKNLLGHSNVKTTEIYTKVSKAYTSKVPSLLNGINI